MISLLSVWGFFRKSLIAQIAVGAVAFFGIWQANSYYQRQVGAQKERVRITENTKEVGRKRNEKSKKIRQEVEVPGSFERLLGQHCRDC